MRTISTSFIATAFALTAYAAANAEEGFTDNTANCYNDITAVSEQFLILANAIDLFKPTDEYDSLHHEEQIVESHLKSAAINCCLSNPENITEEEGIAGVALINNYASRTTFALIVAQSKQPEFDGTSSAVSLLHADIQSLSNKNDALFSCLERQSTPKYLPDVKLLSSTVRDSYSSAKYSFEPKI